MGYTGSAWSTGIRRGEGQMSFSGTVKEELSRQFSPARHCSLAETAAFFSFCTVSASLENEPETLFLKTENESVARKCFTILKKTFNIDTSATIEECHSSKRGKLYQVKVEGKKACSLVLEGTKLGVSGDGGLFLQGSSLITQRDCCRRAFLRGAFLSAGSISDPNKSYHFEIVCQDEEKSNQIQTIIRGFHIDAKTVRRKKSYVVYVKEGAQIVDMLALMGANVALMDLENIRILKEMRNTVNRKVNCETANINKTVNAAVKQREDIRLIERTRGFQSLSEGLAQVAELRLQYPEATLKELGMMLFPQVGKSGVNHRLRKLSELADELRKNEEEQL